MTVFVTHQSHRKSLLMELHTQLHLFLPMTIPTLTGESRQCTKTTQWITFHTVRGTPFWSSCYYEDGGYYGPDSGEDGCGDDEENTPGFTLFQRLQQLDWRLQSHDVTKRSVRPNAPGSDGVPHPTSGG